MSAPLTIRTEPADHMSALQTDMAATMDHMSAQKTDTAATMDHTSAPLAPQLTERRRHLTSLTILQHKIRSSGNLNL